LGSAKRRSLIWCKEWTLTTIAAPSRYALILQKQTFIGGPTPIPVASNPPLSESFGAGNPFQSPIGDEQQLRRGFDAKRSCGIEIAFGQLHHWPAGWLRPLTFA
jgi:hypothetical protein